MAAERTHLGTIRGRVTVGATVAASLVLVVTAVGLVIAQHRILTSNLDGSLRLRADDLVATIIGGQLPEVLADQGDTDAVAQVVGADGEVLAASSNLAGLRAIADLPESGDVFATAKLSIDDGSFRLMSRRIQLGGTGLAIHVGASRDDVVESTRALSASLGVAVPALLAALAALTWWAVGRTLAPIEAIRAEVAAIGGTELHRRVPEPSTDDEVGRLARTMNEMLDRVEEARLRQQRFVADASHELRSPLTRIRSALEVDLAHPAGADPAATHQSNLEEIIGMQRLVEDLLQLARLDAVAGPARRDVIDLDDLVFGDARRLRADGRAQIDTSAVSAARVCGDPDQLARAIRNVTDNAVRHAASLVTIGLAEQDSTVELTVTDDGPGIPPAQIERIFDRFTTLDAARTHGGKDGGGVGLGLAITKEIVERHGGSIVVDPSRRSGARFVVRLPACP